MSAILEEEGEFFPMDDEGEANGFYSRTLQLAMGKLDLKIPRIRKDGSATVSGLLGSHRNGRGWIRKDCESLLLALLTNGYSQTQID